jgi:starch synthase
MTSKRLRVLSVASEVYPLVKTGGLADVAGALPAALAAEGVQVVTLLPGYPAVLDAIEQGRTVARLDDLMGGPAALIGGRAAGLDLLALDAPHLYSRDGGPYVDPRNVDWPDNPQRFAALAQVAALVAGGLVPRYRPHLVHAHDWQAGLTPAYLHYRGVATPSVLTIHNLAFQGRAPAGLLAMLGLPGDAMTIDGVEYYGDIGFLKAGIAFASRVTTVSPTYADEIATEAGGMGLGGLLMARAAAGDLVGILNGIDTAVWDPATDPLLPAPYSAARPAGRRAARAALEEEFGLARGEAGPILAVVSRLTHQKGLDLLLAALPRLIDRGARLALLGSGEAAIEAGFREAARAHPGRVGVTIGYDEGKAHRLQAGADMILVPSRFEPCGLTQLCALRYGAVPVVARVGGLADTVIDANPAALAIGVATGVQFAPDSADALLAAIRHATLLQADRATWARLQANAMAAEVSWARSARTYAALFRALARPPASAGRT